jgi:serpin B
MKKISFVLTTAFLVFISAAAAGQASSAGDLDILASGNTSFALELYGALSASDGNLFFAPYSISTALAMTYGGARGVTEEEMAEVLEFPLRGDSLHQAFRELAAVIGGQTVDDEGFQLHVVNSLWGQSGYEFLPDFLHLLSEDYGSEMVQLDFSEDPEACREVINSWVEEQTGDRIPDLIPEGLLTTATRLVLTNAIYFSAEWLFQFDPTGTMDRPFTLLSGEQVEVPSMTISEHFRTAEGTGFRALELPYRERDFFMLLILPDQGMFGEIEEKLDQRFLSGILDGLGDESLSLRMPRFSSTSSFMLEDVLYSMGMTTAFGPGADFSGMDGTGWLYISSVVHQAMVSVDEYGTEAAAATAVVMAKLNGDVSSPFTVDRPFIYLIMHRNTGTILFIGRMLDPRE